jgi:hypothetical protein
MKIIFSSRGLACIGAHQWIQLLALLLLLLTAAVLLLDICLGLDMALHLGLEFRVAEVFWRVVVRHEWHLTGAVGGQLQSPGKA